MRAKGINLPAENELDADSLDSMETLPAADRLEYCYNCLDYFAPSLPKEKVDKAVKKILKDVEEMYCAPMTPDFSVRVYIHCCTMLERMHTAKPIPMPLDADITISKNLLWYTKLKDVVLEACKAMNVDFVEAEAYYLMMALPTDDLIYEETRDGKEN